VLQRFAIVHPGFFRYPHLPLVESAVKRDGYIRKSNRSSTRPRYVPQEFIPHIYSQAEVPTLFTASRTKKKGTVSPQTFEALILFLYGTGSSLRSAVHLSVHDIDMVGGVARLDNQRGNGDRKISVNRFLLKQLVRYSCWKSKQGIQGERFSSMTMADHW